LNEPTSSDGLASPYVHFSLFNAPISICILASPRSLTTLFSCRRQLPRCPFSSSLEDFFDLFSPPLFYPSPISINYFLPPTPHPGITPSPFRPPFPISPPRCLLHLVSPCRPFQFFSLLPTPSVAFSLRANFLLLLFH